MPETNTDLTLDPKCQEILACPYCKGALTFVTEWSALVCLFDKCAYPIENTIPMLRQSDAKTLSSEEYDYVHNHYPRPL